MNMTLNFKSRFQIILKRCNFIMPMTVVMAALFASMVNAQTGTATTADGENKFLLVQQAFPFSSTVLSNQDGQALVVKFATAKGYYLYHKRFSFKANSGDLVLAAPIFSQPAEEKQDPNFGLVKVYHEPLTVTLPFTGSGEAKVRFQGCADSGLCYMPQTKTVNLDAGSVAASTAESNKVSLNTASITNVPTDTDNSQSLAGMLANSGRLQALAIFFVLGLGLAFTPCVLPMIPILSSIIGGQGSNMTGWKGFYISLAYVLGMASSYALLGVLMATVGQGINLQALMQQTWLLSIFAGLFVLLALAMFGLYELQLPSSIQMALNNQSQRLSGGKALTVFMMGAISALVVSPCVSAPLAGALLYVSTTQDWLFGGGILFVMALGMGVPLVIIGTSGGKFLPQSGPWMVKVKQGFGVMLLAIAILLVSRFAAAAVTLGLWALLVIGCAMYLHSSAQINKQLLWIRHMTVMILLVYGVMLLVGMMTGANDWSNPLSQISAKNQYVNSSQAPLFKKTASTQVLQQGIAALTAPQAVTMVDLYADWCTACKVMDNNVFSDNTVIAAMGNINALKFDITANSEEQTQWLTKHNVFGPPTMLFFDTQGNEIPALRVVGELDKQQFLTHLETNVAAKVM